MRGRAGEGMGRVRVLRPTIPLLVLSLTLPAAAQAPAVPPPAAPLAPLDAYAEAAATTILAEQNCPGTRLEAGRLTTLRLAAKVAPAQEAALTEKLRSRAASLRQALATDGRDAWCANALSAFGPEGTIARGVLVR